MVVQCCQKRRWSQLVNDVNKCFKRPDSLRNAGWESREVDIPHLRGMESFRMDTQVTIAPFGQHAQSQCCHFEVLFEIGLPWLQSDKEDNHSNRFRRGPHCKRLDLEAWRLILRIQRRGAYLIFFLSCIIYRWYRARNRRLLLELWYSKCYGFADRRWWLICRASFRPNRWSVISTRLKHGYLALMYRLFFSISAKLGWFGLVTFGMIVIHRLLLESWWSMSHSVSNLVGRMRLEARNRSEQGTESYTLSISKSRLKRLGKSYPCGWIASTKRSRDGVVCLKGGWNLAWHDRVRNCIRVSEHKSHKPHLQWQKSNFVNAQLKYYQT